MTFIIEKNITISALRNDYVNIIMKLEIGDSFLVNNNKERASAALAGKRKKIKIISRKEGNKIRVWRVK